MLTDEGEPCYCVATCLFTLPSQSGLTMSLVWSQTPEGRAKMSEIAKARWKKGGGFAKGVRIKAGPRPARKAASKKKARTTVRRTALVRSSRPRSHPAHVTLPTETQVAFALGHITCWITEYSTRIGVPASAVAARLGPILHGH